MKLSILGLESTCDETAAAVMVAGKLKSNIIASQIKTHQQTKGVVPEVAARLHYQNIDDVINQALVDANVKLSDITHIAYCDQPGLLPALHISAIAAKTLAAYQNIPYRGFNHLHAHVYSCNIAMPFKYPLVACVFSGGHTNVYYCKEPFDFQLLLQTNDDAIGECLDKIAITLGYQYPGGPVIEKLALKATGEIKLPQLNKLQNEYFSFSGIKSYVINLIKNEKVNHYDLAYSLQKTLFNYCLRMLKTKLKDIKFNSLAFCGGVAANLTFRKLISDYAQRKNVQLYLAPLQFCGDNAAMLANLANYYWNI